MTCEDDCDRIKLNYDDFVKTGNCPDCGADNWIWYYVNHSASFKCKTCRANFQAIKKENGSAKTSIHAWYIAYDRHRTIKYFYAIVRRGKGDERMNIVDHVLHDLSKEELLHIIQGQL